MGLEFLDRSVLGLSTCLEGELDYCSEAMFAELAPSLFLVPVFFGGILGLNGERLQLLVCRLPGLKFKPFQNPRFHMHRDLCSHPFFCFVLFFF